MAAEQFNELIIRGLHGSFQPPVSLSDHVVLDQEDI